MTRYNLPVEYDNLKPMERRTVREQYIREQGGKCWHCGDPLGGPPPAKITKEWINWNLFPKGFRRHPIHLQHDHDTGLTEGAVHMHCNAYLWQYLGR